MIDLEEELYGSKTMQNELLEELKKNEERLEGAVNQLDQLVNELNFYKKETERANLRAQFA
jgi:hypothetical protein